MASYQFPWRAGNALELLVDGVDYVPAMLAAIEGSRQSIALEMYLVESGILCDRFVDALVRAANRGVEVRVLLDGFGSRLLSRRERRRLRTAGVALRFYNPLLLRTVLGSLARDHRKLLLVDQQELFVGGAGITDGFFDPLRPERAYRETMLRVRGAVVRDAWVLFEEVWSEVGGWDHVPPPVCPEGDKRARLVSSRRLQRQEIKLSLLAEAARVQQRLWLATAYFVPSWRVRRALRHAAARGVDVRVLLPGSHIDHPSVRMAAHRHYERLLRAGVRIFEYQTAFLHMKLALADDWVTLGSCNMDHWTLRWNLEANVECRNAEFAGCVHDMLARDFSRSREIDLEQWRRRYWRSRLLERIAGWFDRILTLFSNR